MELYKTYDKDGFLRLEEDGGAALSLYFYRKCTYLISIIVPEKDRRKGIGRTLLSAADGILGERGITRIECIFLKSVPNFLDFMKESGFETKDQASFHSMDIGEFLSGNVRKNPGFILEALKGIKKGLAVAHEDKSLKSVFLVAVNEGVKGLLATLEKGGLKIEGTDMCVLARRKVEKKKRNSDGLKVSERIDDGLENKWMNELEDMAFQKNVTWKLPFARGHRLV